MLEWCNNENNYGNRLLYNNSYYIFLYNGGDMTHRIKIYYEEHLLAVWTIKASSLVVARMKLRKIIGDGYIFNRLKTTSQTKKETQ